MSDEEIITPQRGYLGGGGATTGAVHPFPETKAAERVREDFKLFGTDLFGETIRQDTSGKLRELFDFPPFTVLNAREGAWQERKRAWLACGIQSEVGRGENLLKMSDTLLEPDPEKRAARTAKAFGMGLGASPENNWQQEDDKGSGTSIFDPVLTELSYRWFCPPGGMVVDPFAGGSVRGVVAGLLGFCYHGIDLRPEQVAANEAQRQLICPEADVSWHCGDSNVLLKDAPDADLIFSCPPYGDLEVYSDDPDDLSAMSWDQFVGLYRAIIRKSVERLKPNRFACFVVGEYRDKDTGLYRGFVPLTCASFMAAGAALYNEAILITAVGSLPIRVTKQFETSRKLGKTHQNIIICCKGDPKIAAEAIRGLAPGPAAAPVKRPAGPIAVAPIAPNGSNALAFAPAPQVEMPRIEVANNGGSLADFLGTTPARAAPDWVAMPPPSLAGIKDIIFNFETNGLGWERGDRPIGATVGTLDGKLKRFLPFGFRGGNLDEAVVKEWFKREVVGKNITNAHTGFEVHMGYAWGVDIEGQGNTVSDVMHYAALLDDHRKKFALDILLEDFVGGVAVPRMDERNMAQYEAYEVAARAEYQVEAVAQLRNKMWPMLDEQELQGVRQLEDDAIFAVCEMEKNGSLLDMELVNKYHNECVARHGALMLEVAHECGFAFDHTTTGWKRLFEYCGLTPQDSYAEDIVSPVEHPLVRKAHKAAQYASLDSKTFAAYIKNVDGNGILRYDINQLKSDEGGTVSGRLSIGYIQQVPNQDNHFAVFGDDLNPRRCFISATGRYLEADAKQEEYRLFTHFSGNEKVLAAYRADPMMNFHKMTWEMVKALKPNMVYAHQKNLNFAKLYGARVIKLATMMGFITAREGDEIRRAKRWNDPKLKEANEIEAIYKRVMPEVDELLDRAAHLAKSSCDEFCRRGDKLHQQFKHRGYIKTITGRRSRFPTNYKPYIALNRVLQGSGADIMKRKLHELHKACKHTGLLLRTTAHDAVGGDAATEETLERVREVLNVQSFPLNVPILWECGVGPNWAEAK